MRFVPLLGRFSSFGLISILFSLFFFQAEAHSGSIAPPLKVTKFSFSKDSSGQSRLIIHLESSPENLLEKIDHFHVYLDGRMVAMFSMNSLTKTVTIPGLLSGAHHIWIIAADKETHRILHSSPSSGKDAPDADMMDMGSMGGMSMGSSEPLLSHIPENAMVTSFDVRAP
jgi:hypothetical protein